MWPLEITLLSSVDDVSVGPVLRPTRSYIVASAETSPSDELRRYTCTTRLQVRKRIRTSLVDKSSSVYWCWRTWRCIDHGTSSLTVVSEMTYYLLTAERETRLTVSESVHYPLNVLWTFSGYTLNVKNLLPGIWSQFRVIGIELAVFFTFKLVVDMVM